MKAINIRYLFHCMLATLLASMMAGTASADDEDRSRVKIEGTATGMFVQSEGLGLSQGRFASSNEISGTFSIWAGHTMRTGRFTFPHLLIANLEFPEEPGPPTFLSGDATGAIVWFFDDEVVCDGALAGDFDETGFNLLAKGKLECTDGSRIRLKMRDVSVPGADMVEFDIKGRLISPGEDDD